MSSATPREQRGWFATTHWSMVVSAGRGDGPESREALEKLCESYWIPLYSYVRRCGHRQDDAQDLTQEFFARIVAHNRIARADQQKGRFRSFLLAALKNFLSDEWDKAKALKRGGGIQFVPMQFDTGEAVYNQEPAGNTTPEQIFERRWALTLLDRVLARLGAEYECTGKTKLFLALTPCLVGERTSQPYAELATSLGTTESTIKSAVHRLRNRYRLILREEIGNTVASEQDIDDELRYLFTVLARK
jgi:RNA polymerase sigma factor (sigma-70 family)